MRKNKTKPFTGMKHRKGDDMCIKDALLKAHEEVVRTWSDKQAGEDQNAAEQATENDAEKVTLVRV